MRHTQLQPPAATPHAKTLEKSAAQGGETGRSTSQSDRVKHAGLGGRKTVDFSAPGVERQKHLWKQMRFHHVGPHIFINIAEMQRELVCIIR